MSTRATELGLLWYDFFGLCFTLGLGLLIIYCFIRAENDLQFTLATKVASYLDEPNPNEHGTTRRLKARLGKMLLYLVDDQSSFWSWSPFLLVSVALLTASFWVGMVNADTVQGFLVLGYGIAGIAGLYVVALVVAFVVIGFRTNVQSKTITKEFEAVFDIDVSS